MWRLIILIILSFSTICLAGKNASIQNHPICAENFVGEKYYIEVEDSCVSDTIIVFSVISVSDSVTPQIKIEMVDLILKGKYHVDDNTLRGITSVSIFDEQYYMEKKRISQWLSMTDIKREIASERIKFNSQFRHYFVYLFYKVIPLRHDKIKTLLKPLNL